MANTRSKAKETDRGQSSRSQSGLDAKLMKRAGNSNSSMRSSDLKNSNETTSSSSPLRRSQRETPSKKASQSSPTSQKSTPNSATRTSSRRKSLNLIAKQSSSAKGVSSSRDSKKKSEGKKKAIAENNQSKSKDKKVADDGDDSNSNSNSNSNSSGYENTRELPKKRKRVLLHTKTYKEFFKPIPPLKRPKPSDDQESKKDELKSNRDENNEDDTVIISGEPSKLRVKASPSSTTKSSKEESLSCSKENEISGKDLRNVEIQVVLVPEELTSSDRDILALPVKPIPPVPIEENEIMVIDDEPPTDQQFDGTVCGVCKKAGTLLCCEGRECKTKYHLTCMEPPIQEPPPGVWFCIPCVKKKIRFGAHSVSKGIESIWDVKDGSQNGKQYFVKYKNLAHVHNKWVSETEALREAPDLLSKFTCKFQKEKMSKWKQEWKEPERLLKRRTLMPDEMADEFFDGPADKIAYCNSEWLVKWNDLGYEHATWELETSEFLCNDEALTLISDFEARRDRAKLSSDPSSASKVLELKKVALNKLEKLPDEYPFGLDNDNVISTNRLREFWHKSQNAVFIDDQERVIKTILFIMSVISDVCRPIIIVSNANSLPLWESKFNRLAPKINVVTYTGTKKVRKLIKDTEFYEEGGCIMFQVLLSHPDAILEDLETLDCIGWEAVIVDECQTFRMVAKNLDKFKCLSADFRLLLLSSRLKAGLSSRPNDIISEYVNILAYLDPNNETGLPYTSEKEKTSMLEILKERFACHVAYERALPETSKFLEYWVPVPMSNVQLELYTSTLISNCNALRSFSRIDHVGALRDTLITLRKCCDHPYLVDQDLQGELMKERPVSEILNIGIQACGKFLLFDKLLKDMHARGLRVIILFQAGGGGSGRNKIGDFLDDFLRQRFGIDSYEHIEKGLSVSKRQTAMNNFNNKAMGRFAFLIENRACMPSVKLSSVDAILIYDSEWNPINDLRAVQKISIQPEPVLMPIFRLYSFCAVEEKVLIQAKQDILLDSGLQGVVPSVSQSLLSWGASYLFRSLAKPYQSDELVSPSTVRFLDQVSAEILSKIGQQSICGTNGGNLLTEAKISGTTYSRNSGKLEGEKVGLSSLEGDPNLFWSGLLEGTNPQWRFVHAAEPAQRSRRKVQLFDSLDKSQGVVGETDESRKKKRRNGDDVGTSGGMGVVSPRSKAGTPLSIRNISCEELASPSNRPTQPGPQIINLVEDDPLNLISAQRSLLLLLKPQLINLCHAAGLPEYVKRMAEKLLEHIIQNFQVDPEPENILQAFVLSLVRDLKENSKRRSSINFNVDPDPQRFLHAHLLSLCWRAASLFKHWLDVGELVSLASDFLRYNCEKNHVESIYIRLQDLKTEFQSEADEILASQDPPSRFYNQLFKIPKREITNPTEPSREDGMLQNRIELIEKVFARRQKAILSKHQYVLSQIEKFGEKEKLRIGTTDTAGTGTEEERLQRKMSALEDHIKNQFKRLEAEDIHRLEAEKNLRDEWVRKAKSGSLEDDFDNVPLHDSGFCIDEFVWVCSEDLQSGTHNNNNSLGEAWGEIVNNSELVEITRDDEPINEETVVNEEIVNNEEINENEEIEVIIMEETINGDKEQNTSEQLVQNTGTGQESPSSEPTPPVIPVEAEPVPVPVPVQPLVSVPRTNDHTVAGTSDHTIAHDVARQSTAPNNATLETNSSPLLQMLPMVFAQSLSSDPLKNELMRIKQQDDLLTKRYEYQRQKVQNELEEELEKVKKKYEAILKSSESSFQQQKQLLGDVYNKIIINQSLAEEFRAKFIEHRGAPTNNNASSSQGAARNPAPIQPRPNQVPVPPRPNQVPIPPRPNQVPVPQPAPAPAPVSPRPNQVPVPPRPHQAPVPQSTAPIATTSSPTTATHLRPRSFPLPPVHPLAGPSSTPASTPPIPTISPVRPSTPPIPNRAQFNAVNLGPRTSIEQRAPAPHLSRFRPSPSSSSAPTDQNNPASSAMDKLRAMLASRSGTGTGKSTGTENENLGTSGQRSNTAQVPPSEVRAMWLQYLASTNNGSGQTGTGQTVENGDAVVCLSDDD